MPCTCRTQNPDIPRAGRVGAPGGVAGRGRARLGANRTIRPGKKSTVPSKRSKKRRFIVSSEARTREILCKPAKQNNRLTTVISAVYHRDEKRALFLAAGQWNDTFLFPFHARHVREWKGFTKTRRRSTGRQPGTKSASRHNRLQRC